jgi:hypothetical protein
MCNQLNFMSPSRVLKLSRRFHSQSKGALITTFLSCISCMFLFYFIPSVIFNPVFLTFGLVSVFAASAFVAKASRPIWEGKHARTVRTAEERIELKKLRKAEIEVDTELFKAENTKAVEMNAAQENIAKIRDPQLRSAAQESLQGLSVERHTRQTGLGGLLGVRTNPTQTVKTNPTQTTTLNVNS